MKFYCRSKENCMKKDVCFDCFVKINNELQYEFENKNFLLNFLIKNDCKLIEKYENKSKSKFIHFLFKEFDFIFYECQECYKWYRVFDHPFRLSKNIKNNENLSPTCSKECGYKHRDIKAYKDNGFKNKFCKKCNKILLHNGSICCNCYPKSKTHNFTNYQKIVSNNVKSGKCTSCGAFNNIRSVSGLGKDQCECFNKNMKLMHKTIKKYKHICIKCGYEETSHSPNWVCYNCGNLEMKGGFNREKFYNCKLSKIYFEDFDKDINLNELYKLKGIIGVWSRWTDLNHGNYCLDVCKTKDLGSEILSSIRSFNSLKENPNQKLDLSWKKKYYKQAEVCGLLDNTGNIVFKLVSICKNEKEALKIECQYAYNNKAKYWSPEPGQKIYNLNN